MTDIRNKKVKVHGRIIPPTIALNQNYCIWSFRDHNYIGRYKSLEEVEIFLNLRGLELGYMNYSDRIEYYAFQFRKNGIKMGDLNLR